MKAPWDFSTEPAPGEPSYPNEPTPKGRELGRQVARLVLIEEAKMRTQLPNMPPACNECAGTEGTTPNGCGETLMDLIKCAIDGSVPRDVRRFLPVAPCILAPADQEDRYAPMVGGVSHRQGHAHRRTQMALKIVKSSQPIQITTLVGVIYSPPGIGKTTMAFTADKPLLLDADKGAHRARNRKDIVRVETWADVADMKQEDLAGYSTLIADTAGRLLDVLAQDIIRESPKLSRGGGALSQQGWGELKNRFTAWLKLMRSFGLDVILIAHSDEQRNGDETTERLDVQGGSKNEIYKSADLMGRISIAGGKRILNLSPTETAFGKNPGQLPPLEVPDYNADPHFLAGVISRTKDAINALTEEQTRAAALLGEWAERIEKLEPTAEAFNAQIEPAKAADEAVRDNVKRLLVKVAKERGLTFDPKAGTFSGRSAAPVDGGAPAPREPGSDDGDERSATAPTEAEADKMGMPKAAKKGKAA